MELISARLHNIGPHVDSVIDFSQFRVAAILGRRGKDFRLSNSSGKSHIPDGISWCFFDTIRDEKEDLLRWDQTKGFVKVKFKEGTEKYLVKRTLVRRGDKIHSGLILKQLKPSGWEDISETGIEAKRNTQKKLEDILKANEEIFLHTCYIKQDEINSLMNMKPQERREVFSRPEGLLVYQKGLKIARKKLSSVKISLQVQIEKVKDAKLEFKDTFSSDETVENIEIDLKAKRERRDEIKSEIEELERQRDKNSKSFSSKEKIEILQKAINDSNASVTKIQTDNADIIDGGKDSENKIEEIDRKLKKYDLDELNTTKIQTTSELNRVTDQIKIIKKALEINQEKLEKIKKTCDECGNELTEDQYLEKKRKLRQETKNLDKQLEGFYEDKTNYSKELEDVDEKIEKVKSFEKDKKKLKDRISDYSGVWNKLDQARISARKIKDDNQPKIDELKKDLVDTTSTDDELEELKNKYDRTSTKIGSIKAKLASARDLEATKKEKFNSLRSLMREKLKLKKQFKVLQYNIEMLKTLPNEIVAEAVPEIEQYSNEILQRFENSNLQLRIITEDEKQNETFDFRIIKDGKKMGFKSLGGGDKLRVSFAFRIGNAIRLSHSRGCKFNFLLIDEVDALDENGIEEFIEMIGQLSKMFKHILVISHEEKIKQYFSNQIIVTKKGLQSTVSFVKN